MTTKHLSVVIAMPVYNEIEGISSFLAEIDESLKDISPHFVVVDDCSTDGTSVVLNQAREGWLASKITVVKLERNLGHGPATVMALRTAMTLMPQLVVAVDGDGQFLGSDIRKLIRVVSNSHFEVCEGVRSNRQEPWFRRITTLIVRALVATKARSRPPCDANTPLRVYRAEVLRHLLSGIPDNCLTPNLLVSAKCRVESLNICELPVQSLPRRGSNSNSGTMFGVQRFLPSKKFVWFVCSAAIQFSSVRVQRSRPREQQ